MQDDFRRILTQAHRANGAAALDTIESALATVADNRAETAAQHLATLDFQLPGENKLGLGKPWAHHFKVPLRTRLEDAGGDVRSVGPHLDADMLAGLDVLALALLAPT